MTIIWDNLEEVKDFIDLVNLEKLCANEEEWGGLGFIITGKDVKKDWKTVAEDSYTLHNNDYIIVTPCYKELSWLFRNTYNHVGEETLDGGQFLEGFWAACTGFFLMNNTYDARKLLFFVIDFLSAVEKQNRRERAETRLDE